MNFIMSNSKSCFKKNLQGCDLQSKKNIVQSYNNTILLNSQKKKNVLYVYSTE